MDFIPLCPTRNPLVTKFVLDFRHPLEYWNDEGFSLLTPVFSSCDTCSVRRELYVTD